MARKILKTVSVIQLILAFTIYFSLNVVFGTDKQIAPLLQITNFISTLMRLSIYVIPCITIVSGLFGLVFSAREILTLISGFNIVSSLCLLIFLCGQSIWMNTVAWINLVTAIVYILGIVLLVKQQKY